MMPNHYTITSFKGQTQEPTQTKSPCSNLHGVLLYVNLHQRRPGPRAGDLREPLQVAGIRCGVCPVDDRQRLPQPQ